MRALRVFLSRVAAVMRWRRLDQDLRQEIAAHLDEATEDFVHQGLSPAEARSQALRSFGA